MIIPAWHSDISRRLRLAKVIIVALRKSTDDVLCVGVSKVYSTVLGRSCNCSCQGNVRLDWFLTFTNARNIVGGSAFYRMITFRAVRGCNCFDWYSVKISPRNMRGLARRREKYWTIKTTKQKKQKKKGKHTDRNKIQICVSLLTMKAFSIVSTV